MRDPRRDLRQHLKDIAACIAKIEEYTQTGKESFLTTPMIQGAVVRNFEVIGEATKRIPQSFRLQYPEV